MQPHEFQSILNALPLLTNQQRNEVIEALSGNDSPLGIAETIEVNFTKAPKCPHCGSEELHKWGFRNKRQRYRCKNCHSTLNSFSKTHLARDTSAHGCSLECSRHWTCRTFLRLLDQCRRTVSALHGKELELG